MVTRVKGLNSFMVFHVFFSGDEFHSRLGPHRLFVREAAWCKGLEEKPYGGQEGGTRGSASPSSTSPHQGAHRARGALAEQGGLKNTQAACWELSLRGETLLRSAHLTAVLGWLPALAGCG